MLDDITISIPMPLIISIEDVGWWSGVNGSGFNQPFRTGMPRNHVPEDYTALANLGKGLDMKVIAGFVLCEWDKTNLLKTLPSATWMGSGWHRSKHNMALKEEAAWIIKKEQLFIEFAMHGVGHELWLDGKMQRTEFHDQDCEMRDKDNIRKHLEYYFKLMEQYDFNLLPKSFIPPALKHSFGNGDQGFQKIISEFGIRYVTLMFDKAKLYSPPQTPTLAWENDVLLIERGFSDIEWDLTASEPFFRFNRPVMALHWANILHPDPARNNTVIQNWVDYIKDKSKKENALLSRDSVSCFTQYLFRTLSKIKKNKRECVIDMSWMNAIPQGLLGESIFLKIKKPPGIGLKITGAARQPISRHQENPFIKISLPEKDKIVLTPYPNRQTKVP